MNKVKRIATSTGAALVLAFGTAGMASADASNLGGNLCGSSKGGGDVNCSTSQSSSTTVNVDRSITYGNCDVFSYNNINQKSNNSTDQDQNGNGNANGNQGTALGGGNTNNSSNPTDNSQSNDNSQSQSASITNAPDCSTVNNYTTVQQAAAVSSGKGAGSLSSSSSSSSSAAQVQAPAGGVHAGAGGGVNGSKAPAFFGLSGSVVSLGAGLVALRKRLLLGL